MTEKGKSILFVLEEIHLDEISSYCERRTSEGLDLLYNVTSSKSSQSSKLDPGIIALIKNWKNAFPEPDWYSPVCRFFSPIWDVSSAEELERSGLNQEQIQALIGTNENKLKNELVPRILFALRVLDYDDETFERFLDIIEIYPAIGIMVFEILFNNDLLSMAQPFLDKDSFNGKKEIIVKFLKKGWGCMTSVPLIHMAASCGELIKSIVPDEILIAICQKKLTTYDMSAIVKLVSNTSVIKMMQLVDCHLNSETFSVLGDGLRKINIAIRHLDVSNNTEVEARGWSIVGDIVKNNEVQQLNLKACQLTYDKLDAFNKGLKDCEIKNLTLGLQNLSDDEVEFPVLCELSLKVTETLQILGFLPLSWSNTDSKINRKYESVVLLRDFIHFNHTKNLKIRMIRDIGYVCLTLGFDAKEKCKSFIRRFRKWREEVELWRNCDCAGLADKKVSGISAICNGRLILSPVKSRVEFCKKKFPQLHWNGSLDLSSSDDSEDDFGLTSGRLSDGEEGVKVIDGEDFNSITMLKFESASSKTENTEIFFGVDKPAKELLLLVDDDATTVSNDLIEFCEKLLKSGSKLPAVIKSNMISPNNCFGIAILAKQNEDDVLLRIINDYVADNVNKITESDSFKCLSVSNLKKYLAICDLPDTVKLKLIEASFQISIDIEAAGDQNPQILDLELVRMAALLSTKSRNKYKSLTLHCHRALKHRLSDSNCLETAIFAESCRLYELKVWAEHYVIVNFASVLAVTHSDQELTKFCEISSIPDYLRFLLIKGDEVVYRVQSEFEETGYKWFSAQLRELSSFKTRTIGVEGGAIRLDGCSVTFPEGVFTEDTDITMSVNTDHKSCPDDGMAITPILGIEPSLAFNDSVVTVTMQTCYRASAGESITAQLLTNRGTGWEEECEIELGSSYEISFTVSHFSKKKVTVNGKGNGIYRLKNDIFIQKRTGIISSHFFRFDKDQKDVMKNMKLRKSSYFSTRTMRVEGKKNDKIKVIVNLTKPDPMELSGKCWEPKHFEIQDVFEDEHSGEVNFHTSPSNFDASYPRGRFVSGKYKVFVGSNQVDSAFVKREWPLEPDEDSVDIYGRFPQTNGGNLSVHALTFNDVRVEGGIGAGDRTEAFSGAFQNLNKGRQDTRNKNCESTMLYKQKPPKYQNTLICFLCCLIIALLGVLISFLLGR